MSDRPDMTQLSKEQRRELSEIRSQYTQAIQFTGRNPTTHFKYSVSHYILNLMLDLESGSARSQTEATQIKRNAIITRQNMLALLQKHFETSPLAESIIQELSQVVEVPEYIAQLIREDVNHLQRYVISTVSLPLSPP